MANLKATIRSNITQTILSLCIFLLILTAFIFVRGMAPFFIAALGTFAAIAIGSVILNLQELQRAKFAYNRIQDSFNAPTLEVTASIRKVTLLTCPAPKYDEYLVCALLESQNKEIYVYPFPKEVDGSAPIRKSIRKQLAGKTLKLTCFGNSGVIKEIANFSLNQYPRTAYRPRIFKRK
jgi:hypothetical protein